MFQISFSSFTTSESTLIPSLILFLILCLHIFKEPLKSVKQSIVYSSPGKYSQITDPLFS